MREKIVAHINEPEHPGYGKKCISRKKKGKNEKKVDLEISRGVRKFTWIL